VTGGRGARGGIRREVCLAHVPDAVLGDYVIVHVGFAISRLDEEEAQATLSLLQELGELKRELGEPERMRLEPGREGGEPAPDSRSTPEPPAGKRDP
jgi:hydrogenase expression/formation protein HypC